MTKKNRTKVELEEENSLLKTKLKELIDSIKKKEANSALSEVGLGLVKDKQGFFKLCELRFNPVTKEAVVHKLHPAYIMDLNVHTGELNRVEETKDTALATVSANKFLAHVISERCIKKENGYELN